MRLNEYGEIVRADVQTILLESLQAVLVRRGSQRAVRMEGNVSASVIITGDGDAVTLVLLAALLKIGQWVRRGWSNSEAFRPPNQRFGPPFSGRLG
jgi:hypothetical protein